MCIPYTKQHTLYTISQAHVRKGPLCRPEGWAELSVEVGGKPRTLHAMTPLLPGARGVLDGFAGAELVEAECGAHGAGPGEFHRPLLAGKVALVVIGAMSKESLLLAAGLAGAVGVIGYNGSNQDRPDMTRMMFATRPGLVMVRRREGLDLASATRASVVRCRGVRQLSAEAEQGRRRSLGPSRQVAGGRADVWLHLDGLALAPARGARALRKAAQGEGELAGLTPEAFYEAWAEHRVAWRGKYKFQRILEASIDLLCRCMPSFVPKVKVCGYLIWSLLPSCEQSVRWLRFEPGRQDRSRAGVFGSLVPLGRGPGDPAAEVQRTSAYLVHTALGHELVTSLAPRFAASMGAFYTCFYGEVSRHPPADARALTKLFSACRGPVAPPSGKPWQRADRTWHVTDEHDLLGRVKAEQGRVWWEEDCDDQSDQEPGAAEPAARRRSAPREFLSGCLSGDMMLKMCAPRRGRRVSSAPGPCEAGRQQLGVSDRGR